MLLALTLSLAGLAGGMDGLSLTWQAPAACPDAATVRGRVAQMIGEEALARASLEANATVRAEAGRWHLELELRGAGGSDRRTLVDGRCGALADAAALMIAVAIDPRAQAVPEDRSSGTVVPAPPSAGGTEVPAPPGAGGTEVPAPGTGPAVRVPEPGPGTKVPEPEPGTKVPGPGPGTKVPEAGPGTKVPEAGPGTKVPGTEPVDDGATVAAPKGREPAGPVPGDRSRRGRLALGLRLGAGVGFTRILPAVHAALDLALGLEGRRWRVELGGVFVPPVRGAAASDATIGGRFRLGAAELRGCGLVRVTRAPVDLPLCVGLQVGAMHGAGEGAGLEVHREARALWMALRPGAAVRWRPGGGRVGLWLGLDAIVGLTRPAFITANRVTVHEAARVGGQASVGVEVRLR